MFVRLFHEFARRRGLEVVYELINGELAVRHGGASVWMSAPGQVNFADYREWPTEPAVHLPESPSTSLTDSQWAACEAFVDSNGLICGYFRGAAEEPTVPPDDEGDELATTDKDPPSTDPQR